LDLKGILKMKKLLINAPLLSNSGYGQMSRFALDVLKDHQDKFDIYVNVLNWGQTGWMHEEDEQYNFIRQLRVKTEQYGQATGGKPQFDVSLQITIPNEWKRMAPVNIGYTAGIETTNISPAWLEPSQQMDRIITISNFSRDVFLNTVFQDQQGNQHKVTTPIDVVHFPVRESVGGSIDLELGSPFNFLTVNQWGPRKNMEQLISAFIDEFRDEDVGLVIKTNHANDSIMDRAKVEEGLKTLVASKGEKKCRIQLVHGRLNEQEMDGLYRHPKIKAFVTATHGEGFGMPIFEAVQASLPVIATDWSGHLDFLSVEDKKMFAKVDFELKQIEPQHVWQGVMEANTGWAFPTVGSLRDRMREVYKDHNRFKSWAKKLAGHNKEKFNKSKVHDDFFYSLGIFNKEIYITPKPINGVSFCISTNGKKIDKTLKSIKSILNTAKNANFENFEINIAGVTSAFEATNKINLIDATLEANNGMLAKLRNIAAKNVKYDNIVFLDDDIIFEDDWVQRFVEFSSKKGWNILGNKILLPNGDRYWDRATFSPHTMVDYTHPETDKNLYQTGCFWILRKEVYEKFKWDDSIEYYAEKQGKLNEDVELSKRLIDAGYTLSFDEENTVWHLDGRYFEKNLQDGRKICIRQDNESTFSIKDFSYLEE